MARTPYTASLAPTTAKLIKVARRRYLLIGGSFHFCLARTTEVSAAGSNNPVLTCVGASSISVLDMAVTEEKIRWDIERFAICKDVYGVFRLLYNIQSVAMSAYLLTFRRHFTTFGSPRAQMPL